MTNSARTDLDGLFAGYPVSRQLFDAVAQVVSELGETQIRPTRSQVAFWRRHPFAWTWIPGRYLRGERAPLVLTVGLRRRDASSRWKEIVEPAPGRFVHHLELWEPAQVDEQVRSWLAEAWSLAA